MKLLGLFLGRDRSSFQSPEPATPSSIYAIRIVVGYDMRNHEKRVVVIDILVLRGRRVETRKARRQSSIKKRFTHAGKHLPNPEKGSMYGRRELEFSLSHG